MVLANGRYAIPRKDGHILVGSTLEYAGFDKTPTDEALASLQASAVALLPALADAEVVGHWAGLRPGSPEGIPYIGWSAGSNVANPTIRTTNDMPIIEPPSFTALGIIPFQLNPHFISGKPAGHNGESREERLEEFLAINPSENLMALPEGSALLVEGQQGKILGEPGALHFKRDAHKKMVIEPLRENQTFSLSAI